MPSPTAIHEAGHCLAAILYQVKVFSASTEPPQVLIGPFQKNDCQAALAFFLGGAAAERMKGLPLWLCGPDYREAVKWAHQGYSKTHGGMIARCRLDLLENKIDHAAIFYGVFAGPVCSRFKQHMPGLERLANALERRRTLTGHDVKAIAGLEASKGAMGLVNLVPRKWQKTINHREGREAA